MSVRIREPVAAASRGSCSSLAHYARYAARPILLDTSSALGLVYCPPERLDVFAQALVYQ